ncbi:DUF2911 domain-containing protein [Marinilongibacter aquaticus]|uniref:DUF2911 domain-containing protein n=1 Tax=Marinilongibacter aquaticus TaxID=2975157 RepID=UPI0021BDC67C|nr:DUF2911 domain-containing protein [Marinilongibacter aquaticus]UBM59424.1 DUF2911 domain-containing protein [Marinilongibacter aquaticus]
MQKTSIVLFLATLFSFSLKAQITPQPSPGASFTQTIGITEVSVEYSRPGVKGRKIFGGLLPYKKVWRTGANASTKIRFSTDVLINSMPLPAGTYSIVSFPGEEIWTLVFSRNLDVTEETYDAAHDALRVAVKPHKVSFTETFTIDFSDIRDDNASLNFYWEHSAISVNVAVDNEQTIVSAIEAKNNEAAGAFQQAAEYLVNNDMDLNKALDYIDKSISLRQTFRNTWIKAVLMRKLGKDKEALKLAYLAQQYGASDSVYPLFKDVVEKTISDLKGRVITN